MMRCGVVLCILAVIVVQCCLYCASCPVAREGKPYVLRHRTKINPDMRDIRWSVGYQNGTKTELSSCYPEVPFCFNIFWDFSPRLVQVGDTYKHTLHIWRIKPEHRGMTIMIEEMRRTGDYNYPTKLVYSCTLKFLGHHDRGQVKAARGRDKPGAGTFKDDHSSSQTREPDQAE